MRKTLWKVMVGSTLVIGLLGATAVQAMGADGDVASEVVAEAREPYQKIKANCLTSEGCTATGGGDLPAGTKSLSVIAVGPSFVSISIDCASGEVFRESDGDKSRYSFVAGGLAKQTDCNYFLFLVGDGEGVLNAVVKAG